MEPNEEGVAPPEERERYQASQSAVAEAEKAQREGRTSDAIDWARRAASLYPRARSYELLGESLLVAGQLDEAVLYLAAAAGLGESQARPYLLLAQALLRLGTSWQIDGLRKLQHALRLNPAHKAARAFLADTLASNAWLAGYVELEEQSLEWMRSQKAPRPREE